MQQWHPKIALFDTRIRGFSPRTVRMRGTCHANLNPGSAAERWTGACGVGVAFSIAIAGAEPAAARRDPAVVWRGSDRGEPAIDHRRRRPRILPGAMSAVPPIRRDYNLGSNWGNPPAGARGCCGPIGDLRHGRIACSHGDGRSHCAELLDFQSEFARLCDQRRSGEFQHGGRRPAAVSSSTPMPANRFGSSTISVNRFPAFRCRCSAAAS